MARTWKPPGWSVASTTWPGGLTDVTERVEGVVGGEVVVAEHVEVALGWTPMDSTGVTRSPLSTRVRMFTPAVERLVVDYGNGIEIFNPSGPGQAGTDQPGHCAEATDDSR